MSTSATRPHDPNTTIPFNARSLTPRNWLALRGSLFIAGLTFLIYLPSLRGPFIIDDDRYLGDNLLISLPDGLYHIWLTTEAIDYYPMTNTTLWLEWRLWKLNPTGYRVTNLLLHIGASLLLWRILRRLLIPGAFLAALLWAVHPLNVESVAWIAQRKELLASFFFMVSILAYLRQDVQNSTATANGFMTSLLAKGGCGSD